ncbi:MAG: SprB repeat-containing protein, partial [Bacteroidales bacterium]|nr:SprB repeat-containing protein [Bacteroidales bacterium]
MIFNCPGILLTESRALPGNCHPHSSRHAGALLFCIAGCVLISAESIYSQECTITTAHDDVLCYGEHTGSINISVEGGSEPYAFSWTGPGSFESSDEDLSGLEAGSYTVIAIGADSSCTGTATVTVSQPDHPLEITVQPADQTDCYGNVIDFIVSVNGIVGTPSYQWQYMPPGGDFSNIGGSGGPVLNVPDIGVSGENVDGSQYRVIVTDACQSVDSDAALLSINAITNLTPVVVNSTICSGAGISYEVFTRGDVTEYQWSRLDGSNWTPISNGGAYSGANTSRLIISDATTEQTSS